jgi:hypothetical protein
METPAYISAQQILIQPITSPEEVDSLKKQLEAHRVVIQDLMTLIGRTGPLVSSPQRTTSTESSYQLNQPSNL